MRIKNHVEVDRDPSRALRECRGYMYIYQGYIHFSGENDGFAYSKGLGLTGNCNPQPVGLRISE